MLITRRGLIAGSASALAFARSASAENQLAVTDLYEGGQPGDFSEQARLFNGTPVTMRGFMAPPLKADAQFFVLTTIPMAVCPFCSSISEWPKDIVVVYTRDEIGAMGVLAYDAPISVTGRLDLGEHTDAETGFVSMVRLVDSTYRGVPSVNTGPNQGMGIFNWF